MVKAKRIHEETVERLDDMFRYCFLTVGLREKGFPNELETLFLHQFIRENYGGHSIEEVKMAFRMAVKSELDLARDEVVSYDNFSVLYLSTILNSYRRWAAEQFRRLEKHIPPSESDVKLLEGPRKEVHWGFLIEKAYQHFLSFGDENWKLYPVGFYDQLVKDEIFEAEFFRKAMPIVRKKLIGEQMREKAKLSMHKFSDNPKETSREAYRKGVTESNLLKFEKEIQDYESGKNDVEIEAMAKPYCVLQYFKNSKQNMKQHVYVAAE